tara:strand:+ start:818 stop:1192 length:375 start_codon:yes stop_codon:yes gene_type:complete
MVSGDVSIILFGVKKMTKFYMVDFEGGSVTEFNSRTPREAALKGASRDKSQIVLIEEKLKLHIFEGNRRELSEEEQNEFTKANNIKSKPSVRKMCSTRFKNQLDVKKKEDFVEIQQEYYALIGQ